MSLRLCLLPNGLLLASASGHFVSDPPVCLPDPWPGYLLLPESLCISLLQVAFLSMVYSSKIHQPGRFSLTTAFLALTFEGISLSSSTVAVAVYNPTNSAHTLHILAGTCYLIDNHSYKCEMLSPPSDFDLHFPSD